MLQVIDSFTGDKRFLSNFYPAAVMYDETWYATVEHAYQAAKCVNVEDRLQFTTDIKAGKAKWLGRRVAMRSDWDSVKIEIMRDLVMQKFIRHPWLLMKLCETGSAELVEGNTWGDTFWGMCEGMGTNWLGRILMEVRDKLK